MTEINNVAVRGMDNCHMKYSYTMYKNYFCLVNNPNYEMMSMGAYLHTNDDYF